MATWCPDHPFLADTRLRNAVFASAAIARCMLSNVPEYKDLAIEYARSQRPTYHLLYIMDILGKARNVDIRCFNMLMQSCCEFVGATTSISIQIDGESWEDAAADEKVMGELVMTIEFPDKQQERTFTFSGSSDDAHTIVLGPCLINTTVTLPSHVELLGRPSLEAIGDCGVSARHVHIDTPDLIVRSTSPARHEVQQQETGLFIDSQRADGHADALTISGGTLHIQCCEHGFHYPLAKYVHVVPEPVFDPKLQEKYRRLRRILLEFRSHSRGGLARYRDKIEHERVLKGQVGRSVLDALMKEGIMSRDERFYHIDSKQLAISLGIGWHDLRQHKVSEQLEAFLKSV